MYCLRVYNTITHTCMCKRKQSKYGLLVILINNKNQHGLSNYESNFKLIQQKFGMSF